MFGPNEMFSPTKKRRSKRTKTPKRATPKKKLKTPVKKKTPSKSRGKSKSAKKKTPKQRRSSSKKNATAKHAVPTVASSWLDRLQRSAQQSEIDHTNTSTEKFLLYCIGQAVFIQLVASQISPRFTAMAVWGTGSHWCGYILSLLLGTNKHYDITEDISILAMLWWSYSSIEGGEPSVRQKTVYICATIWCLRLVAFVGYRIFARGSDFRFDKLMADRAYSFFAWTSGGTWCFINFFALWRLADLSPEYTRTRLDALDLIGFFLFLCGFVIETVADLQKYSFNSKFAAGKNNNWISDGLWGWSRHPNYCGEIILWLGLSLVSIGGMDKLKDISVGGALIIAITPVWSLVFLLFTSLMLLEKRADKKWGRLKRYQEYKKNVPVLFPGL